MAIDYQYFEFRAFEYLIRLGQLLEKEADIPQIRELLEKIKEEQELIRSRKFRVAVVGEFKRGKSSFINALLGKEILPVDALPTTATLNRITYGAVPIACLRYKDGRTEKVEIGELSRYVTKLTEESEGFAGQIEEAVVEYPSIFCQNHVDLIDTPGMNDDMCMNDVTLSQLEKIDLAIVTLSPGSPFSDTESSFVARLLESTEICQIVIVVTKIDEVRGEERRKKLLSYLKERIPEKTMEKLQETYAEDDPVLEKARRIFADLNIFGVSSLDALDARQYNDEELFVKSGFQELNDRLPQLILSSQNNNTVLRAIHTIQKIAESYEERLPKLLEGCRREKEAIFERRKKAAAFCYGLVDESSLEELRKMLWEKIDTLLELGGEIHRDFIQSLASVRILSTEVLEQTLKAQAELWEKKLNARIMQEFWPEMEDLLARGRADWYGRSFQQMRQEIHPEERGLKRTQAYLEGFTSLPPSHVYMQLSRTSFLWSSYPVPSKERLLAPDLIVDIRQAVDSSLEIWCKARKKELEEVLKCILAELAEILETVVVTMYKEENMQIERWDDRARELEAPELLEKLKQLVGENEHLEEEFLRQLK